MRAEPMSSDRGRNKAQSLDKHRADSLRRDSSGWMMAGSSQMELDRHSNSPEQRSVEQVKMMES